MKRLSGPELLFYPLLAAPAKAPGEKMTAIRHLVKARALAQKSGKPVAVLVTDSLSRDKATIERGRRMLKDLSDKAVVVYSDNAVKGGAYLPADLRKLLEHEATWVATPYALLLSSDCRSLLEVVTPAAV